MIMCVINLMQVISFSPKAYAFIGMEVDPVEINLKNVPLDEIAAVSVLSDEHMKITIQNKSPVAYTYLISINSLSQKGVIAKSGYSDIPDTSWIWPEKEEVLIQANSAEEVELYVKVPKEYADKKYQAVIGVQSKKNTSQEIFVLAVQINIFLETQMFEITEAE